MAKSKNKSVPAADVAYAKSDEKWRAESDMRTLAEALAIKKDKPRYKRAMACCKEKLSEMKQVVGDNDGDE
jgi:hypothetical protein